MSVCGENVGNWSPSPQNERDFSPKIYQELFPASPGAQVQEVTVGTFWVQLEYNPQPDRKTFFSIRSEILMVFDPQLDFFL